MKTHPLSIRLMNGTETCADKQCHDKSLMSNCLCASAAYELDRLMREVERLEALVNSPNVVSLSSYRDKT